MSLPEDEFLIRKILLTHDPDGRRVDSELLLRAVENVVCFATPEIASHLHVQIKQLESSLPNAPHGGSGRSLDLCNFMKVLNPHTDATNILNIGEIRLDETVRYTINEIRHEILHRCFENQDLHTQAMFILEMLERYKWDAKVALVLAAFGMSYGEFCLMKQSEAHNPLAALISTVKKFPGNSSASFKALTLLINIMVEVSRTINEFESLPLQHDLIENKALAIAKSKIYIASYWIFRSSITCSSLFAGLRTIKRDQVNSSSRIIAARTFSILVQKLNGLHCDLKEQLHISLQHIDTRLSEKLVNLFKETHADNQEVLRVLFAMKNDFPFKSFSSHEKCGIDELKNKVVILLISTPELLPVEKIFWLVEQIHNHQDTNPSSEKYAIIWVPISSSYTWSREDEKIYQFLSNSLPFFSVRQPRLLNPGVVNYIKQEWNFKEEPIMVVLDENGTVTNSKAIDMVWIWGAKAFPFSTSRENSLWKQERSMLRLITDGINPLLSNWVEEGKNVCIYASDNLDWIRQFNSAIKEIRSCGIQLEAIYVGWRNPGESIRNMIDMIDQEKLSASLSFTKIRFFWLRIESIKNSISRLKDDVIVKEISRLIEIDDNDKDFVIIGTGSSSDVVKIQGEKIRECFDIFQFWAKNVVTVGLATTIRNALELPFPDEPCQDSNLYPYEDGLTERISICSKCCCPMEKVVVYGCNVDEERTDNV